METVVGNPQVGKGKQKSECGAFDRIQISIRTEGGVQRDEQSEPAHKYIDDGDLAIPDATHEPKAVEEQYGPHIQ